MLNHFLEETKSNNIYGEWNDNGRLLNRRLGSTQLSNISNVHGTAGGGIWINEKYHGYGYGTEAWGARIKFAFEVLGLRRLENGYFKDNISSFKMQEK